MDRIVLRNEKEIRVMDAESLLAVKVENYLCTFYMENENNFVCTKSLKEAQDILPDYFCKINRNVIINQNKISNIQLKSRVIILTSGLSFSYSRRNVKWIIEKL